MVTGVELVVFIFNPLKTQRGFCRTFMVQCLFVCRVRFLAIFSRHMSKSKGKQEVAGPTPLLGRVGTSLKVGLVGLPNVG